MNELQKLFEELAYHEETLACLHKCDRQMMLLLTVMLVACFAFFCLMVLCYLIDALLSVKQKKEIDALKKEIEILKKNNKNEK